MSKLVDELQNEHAILVNTIKEAKNIGLTSRAGFDLLQKAKTALLAHLEKEDKNLYPVLYKAAENDSALRNTLEFFAKDTEQVSKEAMEFFNKYTTISDKNKDFPKDIGRLIAVLANRIRKEEAVLYEKYNEIKDEIKQLPT